MPADLAALYDAQERLVAQTTQIQVVR